LAWKKWKTSPTLQALADKVNADAVAAGQPSPNYQAFLVEGNDVGGSTLVFWSRAPSM